MIFLSLMPDNPSNTNILKGSNFVIKQSSRQITAPVTCQLPCVFISIETVFFHSLSDMSMIIDCLARYPAMDKSCSHRSFDNSNRYLQLLLQGSGIIP